ncbi:MAG: DUF3606 domain-containing protein [Polyangiaceae bacterium]
MSDDPPRTIMDRIVVMRAPHQIDYWTEYFGVSREEIETVVAEVGPRVDDVQRGIVARKGKITRGRW